MGSRICGWAVPYRKDSSDSLYRRPVRDWFYSGKQTEEIEKEERLNMYEVDARGLSCPEPVMMVAEALKKHPGETLKVLVSGASLKDEYRKICRK